MAKCDDGASARPEALVVSPQAPYPPVGGGALRTSSLIDYLAKRYTIDVITFREDRADVRRFPAGRVRSVLVLDLPPHSKSTVAWGGRNLRRLLQARPPLLDRYSGFGGRIADWVRDRRYRVVLIEHFWCAPYAEVLRDSAQRLMLDLHNVESVLQATTAEWEEWPVSAIFRRFAAAYEDLERKWIPQFDDVLVTSAEDAQRVRELSPGRVTVYPNALARCEQPPVAEEHAIAFSGTLAYHANAAAIAWFGSAIWPHVRGRHPELEWRLIGKNPEAVRRRVAGMKVVGPVEDAIRELAATKVAVVPLRSGSGTRFKILEAWAAGRAVVSTALGAAGLGARDGEHLLLADDEARFAGAVEALLHDAATRQQLGANGRRLYLERFTTEAAWRMLDAAGL